MAYNKTVWENSPSTNTPVNKTNLDKIENGIYDNSINIETICDAIKGTELWENTNMTSTFATQDITLSSSNYDELLFISYDTSSKSFMITGRVLKGESLRKSFFSQAAFKYWSRNFTYVNDTKYTVSDCIGMTASGGATENNLIIPAFVIGYTTNINV